VRLAELQERMQHLKHDISAADLLRVMLSRAVAGLVSERVREGGREGERERERERERVRERIPCVLSLGRYPLDSIANRN
jgi:hypothetical protein